MAVRILDIARAAGVGKTTVMRALSDKEDIRPDTRAKIRKIAEEMNYRPNYIARSLVLGRSNLVGMIVSRSAQSIFHSIVEPIGQCLGRAGYALLLHTPAQTSSPERACIDYLMQSRVAGVIALPSSDHSDDGIYRELVASGTKLVVMDRYVEGLGVPQIICSDYSISRIATDYLVSLGHRDIVCLGIPEAPGSGQERAAGFRDGMSAAGLRVGPFSLVRAALSEHAGFTVMKRVLRRRGRPTAVIARHDLVARGAMRAIYAAGLSIPEDISLIGNGNMSGGDVLRCPLTTVYHPTREMAEIGVRKLVEMLDGKTVAPEKIILGVRLIVRASCAPPKPGT